MEITSEIWWALGAVFGLLCLSAFFSGSETALTAVSKARMLTWEKEGNKRAALVNRIRKHKERMIGALLLGNNLVNILASAMATSVLLALFGEAGVIYATAIMTMLVLIFAEVLPKTYALHYADIMALRIAPIIRVCIIIFSPITALVTRIVRMFLRLFGVDTTTVVLGSNVEELRGAIEMHREEEGQSGSGSKRAMLRSILDLADVEVEDVMTHRRNVTMMDMDMPITDLIDGVLESPFTRIPLFREDQDNIIGVVHAKSLLKEMRRVDGDLKKLDMESIINPPWFIPETTTLYDQLQAFQERREHFSVVVDEYGSFMGVVTLEDILEEIVGEIDDEHDEPIKGVAASNGGSYIVDGVVTIRDLNREYDWNLPDDDYATLAGLILHESQMIPEPGQTFSFHGFQFDILKRHRNQLTEIRITPLK